mmetsp:Transcript_13607/g.27065  ORF Transcript_13607/g.27065 Transcript_13607/m.27065 type:complete len:222 (-) Transcript_13607:290-955(-)
MKGRKRSRCRPFRYRSSGGLLLVLTTTQPREYKPVKRRRRIRASATSVTWNSSKHIILPLTAMPSTTRGRGSPFAASPRCWDCLALCMAWWTSSMNWWKCTFWDVPGPREEDERTQEWKRSIVKVLPQPTPPWTYRPLGPVCERRELKGREEDDDGEGGADEDENIDAIPLKKPADSATEEDDEPPPSAASSPVFLPKYTSLPPSSRSLSRASSLFTTSIW